MSSNNLLQPEPVFNQESNEAQEAQVPTAEEEKKSNTIQQTEQIDILEIYVEKSRAIGLGQRLLWHLDKFNKKLKLPWIPDVKDFYMQPINATARTGLPTSTRTQDTMDRELLYTQDSNTVFYYNDYRVVLLLDFSQSSTTIYQSQEKSYLEKMRDCLTVIIENLLFEIKNEFMTKSSRHQQNNANGGNRKSAGFSAAGSKQPFQMSNWNNQDKCQTSDDSQEESDFQYQQQTNYASTIEEQYESATPMPTIQRVISTTTAPSPSMNFAAKVPNTEARPESNTRSEPFDSASDHQGRTQDSAQEKPPGNLKQTSSNANNDKQKNFHKKTHEKAYYSPRVYLSIVVSGIPPGNHIKIIIHNKKLDSANLKDLVKDIERHLILVEQNLKDHIKLTADVQMDQPTADIQGSLQAHLKNAQHILDLMNQDAKPLLVFLTDCTNSLFELHSRMSNHKLKNNKNGHEQSIPTGQCWQQSGQLDASIHRLHLFDVQLISIDLAEDNKVCQQFGFVNHENELAYLTSITQGMHLTYSKLMDINTKLDNQHAFVRKEDRRFQNLFQREDKVKFEIKNGSLTVIDPFVATSAGNKRTSFQEARKQSIKAVAAQNLGIQFGNQTKRGKDQMKLRQINSLQKIMFARASNYQSFMMSDEIRELLGTDFVTNQFMLKSQLKRKTSSWSDMSISSLLLQNKIVPILECEGLAEYVIRNVGFASLIEFRSKLGFKFQKVEYDEARKEQSRQQVIMQEKAEYERTIRSIEYRYWVTSHIFITCILSLEPISSKNEDGIITEADKAKQDSYNKQATDATDKAKKSERQNSDKIYVSYDIYAPTENLRSINREKVLYQKQQQALDQIHFKSKRDLAKARQEKALATLYGRLHTFVFSIYDRDCHFSLLEKIVQILHSAYPKLDETARQDQQPGNSKQKFKDPNLVKVKNAPKMMNPDFKEDLQTEKADLTGAAQTPLEEPKVKKQKTKKPKKAKETEQRSPEEQARKDLLQNKGVWERLSKRIASNAHYYQWKCYFRYCMFTIMTQTNRAAYRQDAFKNKKNESKWRNDVDLEKIWVQDRQIERRLFEVMREITTFTLNRDTFMNVFVENHGANQYRFGDNHQRGNNQKVHKGAQSDEDIGFCLIKLKWIASNIAECHLGFYQVGPKKRLMFIKEIRKYLNQQSQNPIDQNLRNQMRLDEDNVGFIENDQGEKILPFYCYSKNIPSLLMRLPQRQINKQKKLEKHYLDNAFSSSEDDSDSSFDSDDQSHRNMKARVKRKRARRKIEQQRKAEEMHQQLLYRRSEQLLQIPKSMLLFSGVEPISIDNKHTSLHDLWQARFSFGKQGLPPNRTQLFHQFEWKWENVNQKTNMEFFNRVLAMRLKDGFIIVNRYTGTSDYFHLVKVLRAYKEPFGPRKYKSNTDVHDVRDTKNEKVEIVVQYVIEHYTEKIKSDDNSKTKHQSIVKAKLLMEKETSFFQIEKGEKGMSRAGSVMSLLQPRGHPRFRSAMSRNSSLSKSNRMASRSRDSRFSKGSGQEHKESSDGNSECRTSKDFFMKMRDYMQEIDQVLRQSTYTYHHIVKNSIKRQVELSDQIQRDYEKDPLKVQLCYFKNIQASTRRQRLTLEDSIREKMLILHADWRSFLLEQYPELFKIVYEIGPQQSEERNQVATYELNNVQQEVCCEKYFMIKQLLNNSKHFATKILRAPLLEAHEDINVRYELQRQLNKIFMNKVNHIFQTFADLKVNYLENELHTVNVYVKLLTKRHLLLIQVPQLNYETNDPIQVKYFKFNQDMIKVPEFCTQSVIHKFLSQQSRQPMKRDLMSRRQQHSSQTNLPIQSPALKQIRSEQKISLLQGEEQLEQNETSGRQRIDSMNVVKKNELESSPVPNLNSNDDAESAKKDISAAGQVRELSQQPTVVTFEETTPTLRMSQDGVINMSTIQKETITGSPTNPIECSSDPGNNPDKSLDLIQNTRVKMNLQSQSSSRSTGNNKDNDIIFSPDSPQKGSSGSKGEEDVLSDFLFEQEDENEFEISQIDQQEQVRQYYDHLYRRGRQRERLEFESKVSQIAHNFLAYLKDLLEKAFSEVVLYAFQQDQLKHKQYQESSNEVNEKSNEVKIVTASSLELQAQEQQYQHFKLQRKDFDKAVKSMGYSSFRIDLNFAFIIYYQLLLRQGSDSKEEEPSSQSQMNLLKSAQDFIFAETIRRNFTKCPVDDEFYIYSNNAQDSYNQNTIQQNRQTLQTKTKQEILANYQANLKGTQDAYSDVESQSSQQESQQPAESKDYRKEYSSCENLLFSVTGVIKDRKGAQLNTQTISSFSQIFEIAMKEEGLVDEMVQKARAQDKRNRERMHHLYQNAYSQQVQQKSEEIEKDKEDESSYIDSLAGVDLHFRFYTIPRYVGLIQSRNVDFFRDENDDILVNDDLQEDLLRICRIFNLFDTYLPEEKVQFAPPLFHKVKKNQIIKAIPYYFSQMNKTEELSEDDEAEVSMAQNDHKVFFYTEIQRRIIYGILRRTYAIVSECVCEMLTMVQSQTLSSIAMVQKYFGQLLYNQRQVNQFELFTDQDKKRFGEDSLKLMLADEIHKNNKVVRSAHFHRPKERVYGSPAIGQGQCQEDTEQVKKTRGKDAYTAHEILFETIYYLSGTVEKGKKDDNNGEPRIEFDLPAEWESAQKKHIKDKSKCVKFWCFFKVMADLKLSFTFYVPRFKQSVLGGRILSNDQVTEKLSQVTTIFRHRVKKLLLLQEIHQKKFFSKDVELQVTSKKYTNLLLESQKAPENFTSIVSSEINTGLDKKLNSTPVQSLAQASLTMRSQEVTGAVVAAQPRSKFSRGFNKLATIPSITDKSDKIESSETNMLRLGQSQGMYVEPVNLGISKKPSITGSDAPIVKKFTGDLNHSMMTQQPGNPIIDIADDETQTLTTTQHMEDKHDATEIEQEEAKQNMDMLRVFEEFTDIITTTHQMNALKALLEIENEFENFTLHDTRNMFAIEKDKTINLIRLTSIGNKLLPEEYDVKLIGQQERILFEVLGVDRPNKDYILSLKQIIKKVIQQQTLDTIAENFVKFNRLLQQHSDIDYIKNSQQKRLLMFPVQKLIINKLALLNHLKQSLSRKFLNQIKPDRKQQMIKFDTNPHANHHLLLEQKQQRVIPVVEAPSLLESQETTGNNQKGVKAPQSSPQTDQHFDFPEFIIKYDENEEQLLFNFRVPHEHDYENTRSKQRPRKQPIQKGEMGEFFGFSLAILNFGIVENLTDGELDDLVSKSESEAEVLDGLKEYTTTSFDMSGFEHDNCHHPNPIPNIATEQSKPYQVHHQFSIPRIYGVSDASGFKKLNSTLQPETQEEPAIVEKHDGEINLKFDKRSSVATDKQDHYWIKITLYIQGSLKEAQFVKTLTLVLNQAIADYLLEQHLSQSFCNQADQGAVQDFTLIEGESHQERGQYQPNVLQQPLLDRLFEASLTTLSPLSQSQAWKLQGDAVLINHEFTFRLIRELQTTFRKEMKTQVETLQTQTQTKNIELAILEKSLNFIVIIKKISNHNDEEVGSALLKIPVTEKFSQPLVYRAFQRHVKRQHTLMRNIRVEVQIFIGSFEMQLTNDLVRILTKTNNAQVPNNKHDESQEIQPYFGSQLQIEDLTQPSDTPQSSPNKISVSKMECSPDGKAASPSASQLKVQSPQRSSDRTALSKMSQLNQFKGFSSIEIDAFVKNPKDSISSASLSSKTLTQARNFFLRFDISLDRPGNPKSRHQLTMETFNLSAQMSREIKNKVDHCIDEYNTKKFDAQAQNIAKFQGTMYTLPNFFDVKNHNQLLMEQMQNPGVPSDQRSPNSRNTTTPLKGSMALASMMENTPQEMPSTPTQTGLVTIPQREPRRKRRTKQRKRLQSKTLETGPQFNATQWFRSYFDNFFMKEQRLKKLMQMEDLQSRQFEQNRERSTSQMRSGQGQANFKSMAMVKKSFSTPNQQ